MMRDLFFTDEFQQQVRRLSKRYRHLREDVQPVIDRLGAGETPGDRLQGIRHRVYKVRVPNRDARRGKSGGYRVLYYLQAEERAILLTLYSKSDQSDTEAREIARLLRSWEAEQDKAS